MAEYRLGNAVVRLHGSVDRDKVKSAAEKFLKSVEIKKKKGEKTDGSK